MERVLGVIKDLQFSIGSLVGHSDFLVNPTIRITNQEISISNGFGGSGRGSRCSPQPFSFENAEIRKRQRTCFLVVFFVWGVYFQGYVSPRVPFCSFFSSRGIKPSLRTFFDWRTRRNKCIQSTNVNLETTKRSTTMFSQKMLCVCVGLCVSRVGEIVQWCVRRNDSCNYSHGWVFLLLRFRDHWDCLFLNVALVYFGGGVGGGQGGETANGGDEYSTDYRTRKKCWARDDVQRSSLPGAFLCTCRLCFILSQSFVFVDALAEQVGGPVDEVEQREDDGEDDARDDVDALRARRELGDPRTPAGWFAMAARHGGARVELAQNASALVVRHALGSEPRQRFLKQRNKTTIHQGWITRRADRFVLFRFQSFPDSF